MGDGGEITGAHISRRWKGKLTGPTGKWTCTLWELDMNHFRPYELTRDVDLSIPRVVRVARTIRMGLSRSAKAWRPLTDTATTKSKASSFEIGAFAINHPIVAMLVLGLIALIGSICIFELPIGWLPF